MPEEKSCFDIRLVDENNANYSTTYNDLGWFVRYQLLNNGNSGPFYSIEWGKNVIRRNDIFIAKRIIENYNHINVGFVILNNGSTPQKIRLGVFADTQIGNIDNSITDIFEDHKGFTVSAPNPKLSYTVLLHDIDSFFCGRFHWEYYNDSTKTPFFRNETEDVNNEDTVVAFSWQNREILPKQQIVLMMTFVEGKHQLIPPIIEITADFKELYHPNESLEITVNILYFFSQYTTLVLSDSNAKVWESRVEKENRVNLTLNVGSGPYYEFKVYAENEDGLQSEPFVKRLNILNIEKPRSTNLLLLNHVKGKMLFEIRRQAGNR